MAICSHCGSESPRVRSRWDDKGNQLPDQCPQCAPGEFEKFTAPSDQKIWMGFEANPNQYEKRYDQDGVFYLRKPEYRAEQEDQLRLGSADDREAQARAEERKRRERRTAPMDDAEFIAAIRKARLLADAIQQGTDLVN